LGQKVLSRAKPFCPWLKWFGNLLSQKIAYLEKYDTLATHRESAVRMLPQAKAKTGF